MVNCELPTVHWFLFFPTPVSSAGSKQVAVGKGQRGGESNSEFIIQNSAFRIAPATCPCSAALRPSWTTPGGSHASQRPARTPMKNAELRRIVVVLALALAAIQAAPGQLPPSSPPATSPAAPPEQHVAPLGKTGDLPAEARPGALSDSRSKDTASVAPQGTQRLAFPAR